MTYNNNKCSDPTASHPTSLEGLGCNFLMRRHREFLEIINIFLVLFHIQTLESSLPSEESPENPNPSPCNRALRKSAEL